MKQDTCLHTFDIAEYTESNSMRRIHAKKSWVTQALGLSASFSSEYKTQYISRLMHIAYVYYTLEYE